ncbi:MAG: metal-sensing transcriptional repressor [Polaromonas sp.]|jgi:DNA-binding FrmR family transcriptional regulator|uniref:metal-sensing transcriptional repressor n=1 Tax=Polaromonas sp. TaxID=1869339 RepID=UPI002730BFC6|nr:metal-sensing transcriptional repressor [Polaromonas sp.]MDP2256207.1 metal-sensing transcriptional repressor [Polaromonas sp.]MDP3708832.1 metal-sensing transcriptional repressor [Polaromonas sp.]
MNEEHRHQIQPAVVKRLKRASGHLNNVISMIETQRTCLEVAQQLHAVERAIAAAKKALIHEHLDHCLDHALQSQPRASREAMAEFKDITKYL